MLAATILFAKYSWIEDFTAPAKEIGEDKNSEIPSWTSMTDGRMNEIKNLTRTTDYPTSFICSYLIFHWYKVAKIAVKQATGYGVFTLQIKTLSLWLARF